MNRTTKIVTAAGVAAVLGSIGIVGAVKARDGHDGWRGHRGAGEIRGGMERGFSMMERFDANKDGSLTQAELDQARKDRLATFDTNKDGKLSLKEFEALWADFTRQQMVRAFQRLDGDGDSAVTLEEYVKPTQRMVMRGDRNDDGKLDQQDFRHRFHRDAVPAAPKGETK